MADLDFPTIPRVDAHDKVRGHAIYGSDHAAAGMAYGVLATSLIAKGDVTAIDTAAASRVPGVRLVLTHADLATIKSPGFLLNDGFGFQSLQPMTSSKIAYRGQPIALVVGDTLEAATEGARLISARYRPVSFRSTIAGAPESDIVAQQGSPLPQAMFADRKAGDADAAFAAAPVKVDARFTLPSQHQNPMELIATVAEWRGGRLVVHEGTQNAGAIQHGLAQQLGIPATSIEVISPQAGGAFGQKNSLQSQTVLAAVAARKLNRPVKIVLTREQTFHDASFRPAARHRVRLGADRDGKVVAAIHEVDQQTSRADLFASSVAEITSRLHGIKNFRGQERLIHSDCQTPGYMRAPYEHPGTFAFESAMDELAYSLDHDPVSLRLANDTQTDPITGKPFSSRFLAECLKQGAKRFGWDKRSMAPGSMTADDGASIGWGVACGAYKAATAAAMATITAHDDGRVEVSVVGHEMGQGIRTAVTNLVATRLKVKPETVTLTLGDTRGVPPHLTAGSWGTATAIPTADAVVDALLAALSALNAGNATTPPAALLKRAGRESVSASARHKAPGQPDAVFQRIEGGLIAASGPVYPDFVSMSYVAHFVEVRVEAGTRRVRVPRVVSVADCGVVMSPQTARSQLRGGVIWGIGASLREVSAVDERFGGFLNSDLAEYVLPVNADIHEIDVSFIDKADTLLNRTGVKGLGEVAMTGVAAAVANAVHHATGKRFRDLPIRLEQVI